MHLQSLTGKFPWNTDPPSNGQHYPAWAVWGFYTEAGQPAAGRPQRGARRRHPLVGHEGVPGDRRPAAGVLQRAARTASSARPTRSSAARSRSPPGPETPPSTRRTATTARATSPICPTYNAADQDGLRSLPQGVPRTRARGDPALGRRAGPGPRLGSIAPAGVAELVRRARLKTGCPTRAWGFESLPRHSGTGENLRFSPVGPLSDTWPLAVGERRRSPYSHAVAVHRRPRHATRLSYAAGGLRQLLQALCSFVRQVRCVEAPLPVARLRARVVHPRFAASAQDVLERGDRQCGR